jgi:polysaccharide biosynthesis/export protein
VAKPINAAKDALSGIAYGSLMKSSTNCVLGTCLVFAVAFCSHLSGQTPSGDPPARNSSNTTLAATQPDAPARMIHADDTFIIGNDDVLAINVWKEPDLSKQIPVRSDGKISLPLIGDIQAAGRTPAQLEGDITERLKNFITDPQVAVIVQQINSLKFNILGQVTKPGAYPLTAGTTIVDAIATAGGFRDFAKKKGIYVLRQGMTGNEFRYAFNYQDFVKGKDTKQNIMLKPHDTVVVP